VKHHGEIEAYSSLTYDQRDEKGAPEDSIVRARKSIDMPAKADPKFPLHLSSLKKEQEWAPQLRINGGMAPPA
jgi:hypothetical protein